MRYTDIQIVFSASIMSFPAYIIVMEIVFWLIPEENGGWEAGERASNGGKHLLCAEIGLK